VTPERSVAVLHFRNPGGDSSIAHRADGLTEELARALSGVEGLRVAPRTVTSDLEQRGLGLGEIAKTLGVAAVIDGEVSAC
jgi:TolB-like protein